MTDKIMKLLCYFRRFDLPFRRGKLYLNFCIHSEVIYDDRTYEAILKFSKQFNALTGKKIVMCVSTPICPLVEKSLEERGLSREKFESRVLFLSNFAQIGYHGHFYPKGEEIIHHMRRATYDKDLVTGQIQREMRWFNTIGLKPKIYVGGCWFMMKEIVLELERVGIMVDVSIRKGKTDTFGAMYMDPSKMPDYGVPFILPPAKNIVEIQSIFGPVMPPPLMKFHLSKYADISGDEDLLFLFPMHDWDMPKYYGNIWANVEELTRAGGSIGWMDVLEMREHYLNKLVKGTSENR